MQNSGFPNKDSYAEKQQVKSSLLHDELERKGYEEAGTKKKMSSSNKAEGVGSPKNQVKVMLKDLFKMPNHESPPKTKTKTKVSSSIWKTGAKKRIQEEVTDIISNLDTNVEMMTDAFKTTSLACDLPAECVKMAQDASVTLPLDSRVPDASFMVKEEIKRSKKQKFAQNRTIRTLEDIDFQKNASPTSDSIPNGSQASVETIDDLSLDNFQVEELEPVASGHYGRYSHYDHLCHFYPVLYSHKLHKNRLWIQRSICGRVEEQETFARCSPLYTLYEVKSLQLREQIRSSVKNGMNGGGYI
ncbi:hypothetical protein HanRHA438_Chr16g0748721 [Helianthus annuus]|nr:hypothetical protein HanRHA438_Chr16g0748721 [Helianthus annuus]